MTPPADTRLQVAGWLTGHLAGLLDIPTADIDTAAPLDALGITSMEEVMIVSDLEARYGLALPIAEMRRHPTIEELSAHITGLLHPTTQESTPADGAL